MKKINVIFFIQSLAIGGRERRLIESVKFLKKRKLVTAILVLMEDTFHFDNVSNYFDKIIILRKRRFNKDWRVFFEFLMICKNYKPDIIHTWGLMESIYAIPAKILIRKPLVTSMIADAIPQNNANVVHFLFKKIIELFSNKILSNSYAGLKAYNINSSKAQVIYNGFDFDRVILNTKYNELRDLLECNGKRIILMVASFNQFKDYNLFLDVADNIKSERPDVVFLALGDGPYRGEIQMRIDNELISNVMLLGIKQNVQDYINIADICVLFSPFEGISNSIIEYMAHKKPVIATSLGGTSELIVNGVSGYLMNGERPDVISKKIIMMLDDDLLLKSLGENGYEIIKTKFSINQMIDGLADVYISLCKLKIII